MLKEPVAKRSALIIALAFVATSIGARLLLWQALPGWSDAATAALALIFVIGLTIGLQRLRHSWEASYLVVVPSNRHEFRLPLLALGLVAGALLFITVFTISIALGGIRVQWQSESSPAPAVVLVTLLAVTLLQASWEEWTFRGWPFSVSAASLGPHVTALMLGGLFGGVHLLVPDATPAATCGVVLAGLLLSYSMLAFGNILFPLGLHVGWNFSQSALTSSRLWEVTRHQNSWLSGGTWGLEASVAGLGVVALGTVVALSLFLGQRNR